MLNIKMPTVSEHHTTPELFEIYQTASQYTDEHVNNIQQELTLNFVDHSDNYEIYADQADVGLDQSVYKISEDIGLVIDFWNDLYKDSPQIINKIFSKSIITLPNKTIRIIREPDIWLLGIEVAGLYNPITETIKINTNNDESVQQEALIHELLHVVEHQLELNGEISKEDKKKNCRHEFISYAAPLLVDLINKNF